MPNYPLNRDNAWKAWTSGNVKGVNYRLDSHGGNGTAQVQDASTGRIFRVDVKNRSLANLAVGQGFNAVRVWLSGWTGDTSVEPLDWDNIGDAGLTAPPGSSGWDAKTPLANGGSATLKTIADLAALVTKFLDQCQQLGVGVIFTGDYALNIRNNWPYTPWAQPGSFSREHLGMFWVEVMKKWGKHKALIGLDILNEPAPPTPLGPLSIANWRKEPTGWPTLADDVVAKVRAAEQALKLSNPIPIIVEAVNGGDVLAMRVFDPYTPGAGGALIQDPADRIVYSIHHYSPFEITHQGIFKDSWPNLGRVYGKSVARGITGKIDTPYESMNSFGEGWGDDKRIVKDEATLEAHWKELIDFQDNAAAAGKPVTFFVGEFAHIHPDVNQVEPVDPKRSYLIDPDNGVPAYRVFAESEQYRHVIFSPTDRTGGWKKQNPSRWVTRFEPFVDGNGVSKVRLYFDNLDRLLFGRTWFPDFTEKQLGSLVNNITSGVLGKEAVFIDPIPPTPRPRAIMERICVKDAITGELLLDKVDRNKVPLENRGAIGFAVTTKLAEADDVQEGRGALEWPIEKFSNTLLMDVVGPEGDIIRNATVTVRLDTFWIEVNASEVKIPAYRNAVDLDPNMFEGKFPAKAVAVFSSATPNAEFEKGRDQYIADTLNVCRRRRISWAFLDACGNTPGFIGWRPSAATLKRLKADCDN